MRPWNALKRRCFTLIELIVTLVIAFIGLLFVAGIIIAIVLCVKGCNKVKETGIKPAVQQVWEGPNSDSTVPTH